MLTIKRVPTLISMNQEQNCGHNCLGTCCLSGARVPVYTFGRHSTPLKRSEDVQVLQHLPCKPGWQDCAERGLFRYDVTICETKILGGECGFVGQLNEGRYSKKRPTEFRVDKVLQPFDPTKFNFTKVRQEEVLFRFEESADGVVDYFDNAPIEGSSPNILVINVSPIEYGHILLVPRVMDCIPQWIDPDTLLLALHLTAEVNNANFRVGYNSLGAFATVNQLHFQAYYLNATFSLERAPTTFVCYPRGEGGVKVSQVGNYPVRSLVFEIGSSLEELADEVARVCMILQDANIPYNMLITDRGAKIVVIPQCFAERQVKGEVDQTILDMRVNPAVWEISGHIILFRREDFEMATEDYAWKLLAEVSLSADLFEELKSMCSLRVPEESLIALKGSADLAEDDSVNAADRKMIGRLKAKVRKSRELQSYTRSARV
ncbi:unnamed protein product [Calypogeia fissa]